MILAQYTNNIKMIGMYNAIKHLGHNLEIIKEINQIYNAFKLLKPKKVLFFIDSQSAVKKTLNTISAIKSENQEVEIKIFSTDRFEGIDDYIDLKEIGYLTDIPLYGQGVYNKIFAADIVIISDSLQENEFENYLIKSLENNYTVKIFGSKGVQHVEYLGFIEEVEYKNIFSSSQYLIVFDNYHYINQAALNNCLPLVYGIDFNSKEELLKLLNQDNSEKRNEAKISAAMNSYLRYVKDNVL